RVLATNGLLAVVVAPDRQTVSVIDALAPDARALWSGELGLDPQAAVTDKHVILLDRDRGRLLVLRQERPMTVALDIKTKASIAGYGTAGIVLTSGRSVGYFELHDD